MCVCVCVCVCVSVCACVCVPLCPATAEHAIHTGRLTPLGSWRAERAAGAAQFLAACGRGRRPAAVCAAAWLCRRRLGWIAGT